jgi:hypothetical protein
MYTYVAPIERIEQALSQTESDLLALFEGGVPVCGGVFPLETLKWLARNVLGVSRALESAPTECAHVYHRDENLMLGSTCPPASRG